MNEPGEEPGLEIRPEERTNCACAVAGCNFPAHSALVVSGGSRESLSLCPLHVVTLNALLNTAVAESLSGKTLKGCVTVEDGVVRDVRLNLPLKMTVEIFDRNDWAESHEEDVSVADERVENAYPYVAY